MRVFAYLSLLCLAVALHAPAKADELADGRRVALDILVKIEQKKGAEVWEHQVSAWFKERMTRKAFLANSTIMHAQLGGPATRRNLIQQNRAEGDAGTGYKGMVLSYLFETTFPVANLYETITLIEDEGELRLAGLNYVPNPNK